MAMQPATWMREPAFKKVRRKLFCWLSEDFINMARHLFGTEALTLDQMLELCSELKKPGILPPGGLVARDPIIVMRDNRDPRGRDYTDTGKSRLYLAKNRVGIQFASREVALAWAYKLMVKTGLTWERAVYKIRTENLNLTFFHQIWSQKLNLPGLCGLSPGTFELDHQLDTYLKRMTKEWRRLVTAYPDSTPIRRVYHSLAKGDQLIDSNGELWEIVSTRPNLSGPQEILLEPVKQESPSG